eukprot:gnl/Dysnectes_brevis/180_a208_6159.p1 GENE.gnl/Dysnectes_brevis/180_a208_6159~~gnl/Dysnectes_brevis/180_a208_6159.p1  ORF type:complete len:659 (-),score=224.78 gnl/Dysnectes_brevis/180_a208_6159:56-1993(-)
MGIHIGKRLSWFSIIILSLTLVLVFGTGVCLAFSYQHHITKLQLDVASMSIVLHYSPTITLWCWAALGTLHIGITKKIGHKAGYVVGAVLSTLGLLILFLDDAKNFFYTTVACMISGYGQGWMLRISTWLLFDCKAKRKANRFNFFVMFYLGAIFGISSIGSGFVSYMGGYTIYTVCGIATLANAMLIPVFLLFVRPQTRSVRVLKKDAEDEEIKEKKDTFVAVTPPPSGSDDAEVTPVAEEPIVEEEEMPVVEEEEEELADEFVPESFLEFVMLSRPSLVSVYTAIVFLGYFTAHIAFANLRLFLGNDEVIPSLLLVLEIAVFALASLPLVKPFNNMLKASGMSLCAIVLAVCCIINYMGGSSSYLFLFIAPPFYAFAIVLMLINCIRFTAIFADKANGKYRSESYGMIGFSLLLGSLLGMSASVVSGSTFWPVLAGFLVCMHLIPLTGEFFMPVILTPVQVPLPQRGQADTVIIDILGFKAGEEVSEESSEHIEVHYDVSEGSNSEDFDLIDPDAEEHTVPTWTLDEAIRKQTWRFDTKKHDDHISDDESDTLAVPTIVPGMAVARLEGDDEDEFVIIPETPSEEEYPEVTVPITQDPSAPEEEQGSEILPEDLVEDLVPEVFEESQEPVVAISDFESGDEDM